MVDKEIEEGIDKFEYVQQEWDRRFQSVKDVSSSEFKDRYHVIDEKLSQIIELASEVKRLDQDLDTDYDSLEKKEPDSEDESTSQREKGQKHFTENVTKGEVESVNDEWL
jgi:hypothetical protein